MAIHFLEPFEHPIRRTVIPGDGGGHGKGRQWGLDDTNVDSLQRT